jgi:L-seryl-tRNA(Ser) seleniumtransferase
VGGGTYPEVLLPSWGVALAAGAGAHALAESLRQGDPAVVGRIEDDRVVLDVRTVNADEDAELLAVVVRAWRAGAP